MQKSLTDKNKRNIDTKPIHWEKNALRPFFQLSGQRQKKHNLN